MKTSPPKAIRLVYWYHDKDTLWLEALEAHLRPFRDFISTWHSGKIPPGANGEQEFSNALARADIILPLVSADFLYDDLNSERIQQAVERHQRGEVQVVPVILRPVNWEGAVPQSLEVLPPQGKPVVTWGDPNDVLKDDVLKVVAAALRDRAKKLLCQKQGVYWVHEGNALLDTGEYDQALRAYEQMLALDSEARSGFQIDFDFGFDVTEVYRKRAELLLLLKRYKRAWNAYGQLFTRLRELPGSLGPTAADYIHLAEACSYTQHFTGAEAAELAYKEALLLVPENADVYYNLAHLLFYKLRKREEAITVYDQAIRRTPNIAQWYIEKGHALRDLRRYDEALKAYDTVLRLDARNDVALMNKGLIFCELEQYENALQVYQSVIFLDPTNAMAFYNMAVVLQRLNKYSEQYQALDHAKQLGYSKSLDLAPRRMQPGSPRLEPWPIPTSSAGVPDTVMCPNGHTNPFGSVWCEKCEELLAARLGDTDEKEVEVSPKPHDIQRQTRSDRW